MQAPTRNQTSGRMTPLQRRARSATLPKQVLTSSEVRQLVKQTLNSQAEKKFYFNEFTLSPDTSGNVFADISAIPQGITDNSRIGDTVNLKRLDIRIGMVLGDTTNVIRIVVFQWHADTVNDPPSLTAGLPLNSIGGIPFLYKQNNVDEGPKYTIMHDETFNLNSAGVANAQMVVALKIPRPRMGFAAATTIRPTGSIWMLTLSDSSAAPHPLLNCATRIWYTDE
jgi:hypothetical protein